MELGNRTLRHLPTGIIDSVKYKIRLQEPLRRSRCFMNSLVPPVFEGLLDVDLLDDWLDLIEPEHHEHVLLNFEQAREVKHLVSVYLMNLRDTGGLWVIDYAECRGDSERIMHGTLLAAEGIDDIAHLVKKMVIR